LLGAIAQRVVVYDNLSSGGPEHLVQLQNDARLTVIQNDVQNLHAVNEAITGADIVFHLASNPDISKAATQPDIDFWQGTRLGFDSVSGP
jgi:UDP-glucose 4-epimerase